MTVKHKLKHFKEILTDKMNVRLNEIGFKDISKADNVSRGKVFLEFYLYDIFSQIVDIDDDEIENGIVDGSNDLGIDFVYIRDKKVLIIQSKYGSSSLNDSNLLLLRDLPSNLNNTKYKKRANKELKSILNEIEKIHDPNYELVFLTNQQVTHEKIEDRKESLNLINNESVEYEILTLSQIRQEYERVLSLESDSPEEIVFNLGNEDCLKLEHLESEYETILITQKGTKIRDLYRQHHESLFNYNIRYWLGFNKVNKGMNETIDNDPDRFFYYNNGISAVCEKFEIKDNELICKNFQIINGAQTVTTISKSDNSDGLSSLKLLIKIVQGERGKKAKSPAGLNENIVKFNNSQTTINAADFRSNDPVQTFLETYSNSFKFTLNSPFKNVFYKRKRRKDNPKKNSKIISNTDLGKAYYAFKYEPHILNANSNLLWNTSNEGLYYWVFGDKGVELDVLKDNHVYELFGAYYIYEYIKTKLKSLNPDDNPAKLFKFHVLWALRQVLLLKYREENILTLLQEIINCGSYINEQVDLDKEKLFSSYTDKAISAVNKTIKSKQKKDETFVIRNAQRDKKFTDEIKEDISLFIHSHELDDLGF